MAVIFTVSRQESMIIFRLNFPYRAARTMAPSAPTEADSVGVAIPAKMEPSTMIIRVMGGRMAQRARFRDPFL